MPGDPVVPMNDLAEELTRNPHSVELEIVRKMLEKGGGFFYSGRSRTPRPGLSLACGVIFYPLRFLSPKQLISR